MTYEPERHLEGEPEHLSPESPALPDDPTPILSEPAVDHSPTTGDHTVGSRPANLINRTAGDSIVPPLHLYRYDPYHLLPAPPPPPRHAQRAAPTTRKERILALDVVRGIAVFGILAVNIESFAMADAARRDPFAGGGTGELNMLIWRWTIILADTKFIALFSMLFGAGIALLHSRHWGKPGFIPVYYRRMLFLIALGFFHAHFIWFGDILFVYGMYGLLLFWLAGLPAPLLLLLGGAAIGFDAWVFAWPESFTSPDRSWMEIQAMTGTWAQQAAFRSSEAWFMETTALIFFAPQGMGYMVLGMGLLKSGVLTGRWPVWFYFLLAVAGFAIGIPMIGTPADWGPNFHGDDLRQDVYWGSFLVTLGWLGLAVFLAKALPRLVAPFSAVGRLALTNYLMHSIICTYIFYGWGLGLFHQLDRVAQWKIVLGIYAFQFIFSPLWLRYFRFGPIEWLWRSATYARWQPMLKSPGTEVTAY